MDQDRAQGAGRGRGVGRGVLIDCRLGSAVEKGFNTKDPKYTKDTKRPSEPRWRGGRARLFELRFARSATFPEAILVPPTTCVILAVAKRRAGTQGPQSTGIEAARHPYSQSPVPWVPGFRYASLHCTRMTQVKGDIQLHRDGHAGGVGGGREADGHAGRKRPVSLFGHQDVRCDCPQPFPPAPRSSAIVPKLPKSASE